MTALVEFDVRGLPIPQGTARAFVRGGRATVVTRTAPLLDWRQAIATEARTAMADRPLLAGPISVSLAFRFPRPKGHYLPAGSRRPTPELRLDAPSWVIARPDADKIARAALDALTAVVFGDDAQVAELRVSKHYAEGRGPGVSVIVRTLS